MSRQNLSAFFRFFGCVLILCLPVLRPTTQAAEGEIQVDLSPKEPTPASDVPRVSLEVARDRARIMHDLYSATLDTLHHHYFHVDKATLPARAMEDLFKEIKQQHQSQARWISASFKPMSIDHTPKSDFEIQAAAKIAKGELFVETIDSGFYRRAGSISLNHGCISCHSGTFGSTSPGKKFAGLVISIPIENQAELELNGSE